MTTSGTAEDLERRRVVITGVGAVTAAGPTTADFWRALTEATVHTSALNAFDPPRAAAAGQINEYNGPAGVPNWLLQRMDRASQFALDAGIQAVEDARIEFSQENAFAVGAITGTAHPGAGTGSAALGSGLAGLSVGLNIGGPVFTISAGGASGLAAVVTATQLIRSGMIRAALAIGAEAPLRADVWNQYEVAGLLDPGDDPHAQRPYDARRQGLVLGEGAAALMLEDRQLATQRGVKVYAEIGGEAMSAGPIADSQAPTDVEIARRAIGEALRSGEVAPGDIDVAITAGIGTPNGDPRETDIIERSFGRRVLDMYVTTTTPNVGYTLGASGTLSALAAAMVVSERQIFPHATYAEADPTCGLDIARRLYRDRIFGAVTTAHGTHGQNAALALLPHVPEAGDELPVLVN